MNDMIFYRQDEIGQVILDFVSSEELDTVVSNIQNNARSGFISGLSFAGSLIMAKCHPYHGSVEEDNNNV